MRRQTHILFIGLSLLLSACSTIQPLPQPLSYLPWPQRQQQLQQLQSWNLTTTFSITQNHQRNIANCSWQQRPQNFSLLISSPMNLASIKIYGNQHQVTLWQANGKKIRAQTPEQLLQKTMHWRLPITNLRYWIVGLPAPNSPAQKTYDNFNHLKQLRQNGWQITYSLYQNHNNIDLPHTLLLRYKNLQIKMVIRQWQLL